MSRKYRPHHQRSHLNEVQNATSSAVIAGIVRFLLDQLRELL